MHNRILAAVAAVSAALGGYLHFHVWQVAYRHAPVRELFVLNAVLSVLVALALLARPGAVSALAGLLLAGGSLLAFGLSRSTGLATLHGKFTESGLQPHNVGFLGQPAAVAVLAAEGVAVLCCLVLLAQREVNKETRTHPRQMEMEGAQLA